MVQVSHPYFTIDQIYVRSTRILVSVCSLGFVRMVLNFMNVDLAWARRFMTSFVLFPSSVSVLPRYENSFTCFKLLFLIYISHEGALVDLLTVMVNVFLELSASPYCSLVVITWSINFCRSSSVVAIKTVSSA